MFLKRRPKTKLKIFNTIFWPQWKDRRSSYRVRQILAHFCNLTAQILDKNTVKGITVTKIAKEIAYKGVWGKLNPEKCIER